MPSNASGPIENPTPVSERGQGAKPQLTKEIFLRICNTLEATGAKYHSCEHHGFSYETIRNHINEKEDWKAEWDGAYNKFRETLEAECYRRAVRGWEEPVWFKGAQVGTTRKFSDRLLELRMKGEMPEKYRENIKMEADVTGGVLVIPAGKQVDEWEEEFVKPKEGDDG